MRQELVPTNADVFATIQEIVAQGIRRPAYPADRWTEEYCLQRFRDLGMENVRAEPFEVTYWEPQRWSLTRVERRQPARRERSICRASLCPTPCRSTG